MKNIFFIVLCLGVSFTGMSQAPGYLGKRFTLSYEQLAGPNYFNLLGLDDVSSANRSIDENNANLNYTGMLTIDYVINKTKSRGISISPINQTMYFEDGISTPNPGYSPSISNYINSAKLSGITFGLYVKYFKKQWIAPLGENYKIEFLYSSYKIKSFEKQTDAYNYTLNRLDPYTSVGVAVTHDVSRVYFDRMVISFGITMGYRLNFINPFIHDYSEDNATFYINRLKIAAHYWHGQNLFFNLHTGIGFLLF